MTKMTAAAIKKALAPFKKALLGTPALASYEIDGKTKLPKAVLAGSGGKSNLKNNLKLMNIFYTVTVDDTPLYLHYQLWQPNKAEFDPGGVSFALFNAAGEGVGMAEVKGKKEVSWTIYNKPSAS